MIVTQRYPSVAHFLAYFLVAQGSARRSSSVDIISTSVTRRTPLDLRCFSQDRLPLSDESPLAGFPHDHEEFKLCDELDDSTTGAQKCMFGETSFIRKVAAPTHVNHVRNEFAAIKFFGVFFAKSHQRGRVPSCCLYDGSWTALTCQWIDDLDMLTTKEEAAIIMQPFFLVSVLAGHYDIGTPGNTMVKETVAYFLDLGGTFGYSATGSMKLRHRCEEDEDFECILEDRKCYCATWGSIPFQILDFRRDMFEGGWSALHAFWGSLNGSSIKNQFDLNAEALRSAVRECCHHSTERSIRVTLNRRFEWFRRFFVSHLHGTDAVSVLDDDDMSTLNQVWYWRACTTLRSMVPSQLEGRTVRKRIRTKTSALNLDDPLNSKRRKQLEE
eukprot:TRINITY_DN48981_c0_g1_i1.p1 TRINITY_DN48981_c0_g1~~TRINITY_DN48981_c0_g1_i1.p1  ORF type:complete len:409 (-),score=23.49 TRINITY_DN48981_c0_g1_i1:141-1295(-)